MKKKKIFAIIFLIIIFFGFIFFEGYSILKQEFSRQLSFESFLFDDIEMNLNLIKVAVQTNDSELFEKNIYESKEKTKIFSKLFLLKEKHSDYYSEVENYINFLEEKESLLIETAKLKDSILEISRQLKESYGDKATISRDAVRSAVEKIASVRIKTEDYTEIPSQNIIESTNSMLDLVGEKVNSLSECIDTCYKDSIVEITNSMNDILKDFSSKITELNNNIEKEYDFETLEKLKTTRPEGY